MFFLSATMLLLVGSSGVSRSDSKPAFNLFSGFDALMPGTSLLSVCTGGRPLSCDDSDWECSSDDWRARAAFAAAGSIPNQPYGTVIGALTNEAYRVKFQRACWRHDGCYRHGAATYGLSRTQCDDMFYEDMKEKCDDIGVVETFLTGGLTTVSCKLVAFAYYRGVQNAGERHYHHETDASRICAYDGRNENVHVSLVGLDGSITTVDRHIWTSGWWTATIVGDRSRHADDRLLLVKPTGPARVYRPLETGQIGSVVKLYSWSDGWTNVRGFSVGTRAFLFLLKTGNGTARVYNIADDGSLGAQVADYNWSPGWTISEFYEIGNRTYLLLVKGQNMMARYVAQLVGAGTATGGTGVARIYRMNPDGTVGARIYESDWSSGWSVARPYSVGGNRYMFRLKADRGTVHVNRINGDGMLGERIATLDWSSGWTTAEFFENGDNTYLFLLKSGSGVAQVNRMNDDGTIGAKVKEYDWRTGWTSATFYRANGRLFALFIKAIEGGR